MSRTYDIIVLGCGTMGAATAMSLADRGCRVLALDQFSVPNTSASHAGHSRLFRLAYFEHPAYVPLLVRAFDRWKALEQRSGTELFHVTGAVYIGDPDGDLVARSHEAAVEHGVPHERFDHAELVRRFPPFRTPEPFDTFYEPRAGFVRASLAVGAFAEQALLAGAEIRGHERVVAWDAGPHGVRVTTVGQVYEADRLVITAGAWTTPLVRDLGVPLTVTRQVLGWVWPRRPELFRLGEFPCWAIEEPATGDLTYGFPMMPALPGIKTGRHFASGTTDPDRVDRSIRPGDMDEYLPPLRAHLPDAAGPLLSQEVCLYTNSPDGHFILDRHPATSEGHDRVTIACGFSGHGFKFAPVIGEALADLTTEGRSELPIGFLGLSRFA